MISYWELQYIAVPALSKLTISEREELMEEFQKIVPEASTYDFIISEQISQIYTQSLPEDVKEFRQHLDHRESFASDCSYCKRLKEPKVRKEMRNK